MSDHLFVFGTLLSGYDHPMARMLSQQATLLGEARCSGKLYLVKHYPGMTLSADPADVVFGELLRMHDADKLLKKLDAYEGCGEGAAEPTEYIRQRVTVTLAGGEAHQPGPTSTTGPSPICRASPWAGFSSTSPASARSSRQKSDPPRQQHARRAPSPRRGKGHEVRVRGANTRQAGMPTAPSP